jgi:hypothetical protein
MVISVMVACAAPTAAVIAAQAMMNKIENKIQGASPPIFAALPYFHAELEKSPKK